MGTSVRSSPSIVVRELQVNPPKSQWLSFLRRRRLMPSTSPLTSTTSRETARLMPSTPETSSVPATCTPPSRPSRRSEVDAPRERSSCPSPMYSPCTRTARTPRTREASTTSLRSRSCATLLTTTASSPSSLSWRRCALLRSKRFTLSLSSEYKKPPIFHHNVWSKLDELAEHLAKTELIPV